jgi:hypothetical protein
MMADKVEIQELKKQLEKCQKENKRLKALKEGNEN